MDAYNQETQQQESHMTVDHRAREQLTKTARIKMCQLQLLKTNQSQQSIILYKLMHNQLTSSPEEDSSSMQSKHGDLRKK